MRKYIQRIIANIKGELLLRSKIISIDNLEVGSVLESNIALYTYQGYLCHSRSCEHNGKYYLIICTIHTARSGSLGSDYFVFEMHDNSAVLKNHYTSVNVPDWVMRVFNESVSTTAYNGLMSAADKSKLSKYPEYSVLKESIKNGMVIVSQTSTSELQLASGTTSIWSNPISSLSFDLVAPTDGTEAHYRMRFIAAAGFQWNGVQTKGELPSWKAGNTYEIDIVSDGSTNWIIAKEWEA